MYCAPGLHCPCTNLKIINYTVLLSIHVNNPRVLKVEFLDNWWIECSMNWLFFIGYNHILFGYIVLYVNIIRRRPFYQIYILKRWVFIYDVSISNLFGFFLKFVFNFENDSLKPLLIKRLCIKCIRFSKLRTTSMLPIHSWSYAKSTKSFLEGKIVIE